MAKKTDWALIGIVALIAFMVLGGPNLFKQQAVPGPGPQLIITAAPAVGLPSGCGSDKAADIGVRYRNTLDTTQEEYMALSMRIYGSDDNYLTALTTNAGTGSAIAYATDTSNVACGDVYTLRFVSDADASGNVKPLSGNAFQVSGAQVLTTDAGMLKLQLTNKVTRVNAMGREHSGELETRIKDHKNDAYMFSNTTTSAVTWETDDPANFTSTTDNLTATTINANDYLEITIEVRPQTAYEERNDFGTWILFDMGATSPRTYWDDLTTIQVNGISYNEAKGTMNVWEAKRYTDFEFAFFIPDSVSLVRDNYWKIYAFIESSASNPTERIITRLATRGQFSKTDGTTAISAADDTTSNAAVLDEHDIRITTI